MSSRRSDIDSFVYISERRRAALLVQPIAYLGDLLSEDGSVRIVNCLASGGVETIGDLFGLSVDALCKQFRNMGTLQAHEIIVALEQLGLYSPARLAAILHDSREQRLAFKRGIRVAMRSRGSADSED